MGQRASGISLTSLPFLTLFCSELCPRLISQISSFSTLCSGKRPRKGNPRRSFLLGSEDRKTSRCVKTPSGRNHPKELGLYRRHETPTNAELDEARRTAACEFVSLSMREHQTHDDIMSLNYFIRHCYSIFCLQ